MSCSKQLLYQDSVLKIGCSLIEQVQLIVYVVLIVMSVLFFTIKRLQSGHIL